jgi:putative ABC transport system permease protein
MRPSALGGLRLLARALAAFPTLLVMIITVTLGLAMLATTLPRALDGVVSDIVRHDVAASPPINRDLIAPGQGFYDLGPSASGTPAGMSDEGAAVWGTLDDQLAGLRETLPESMQTTLGPADFTAATKPASSGGEGLRGFELGLRYDPRYLSRIEITEGRAPENTPPAFPDEEPLEVIVSEETALLIDWAVGAERPLALPVGEQRVVLVGIFTTLDPGASYWSQATATRQPVVKSSPPPSIIAYAFANPGGFPAAAAAGVPILSSVWFATRPDAVTADAVTALAADTRQLGSATLMMSNTAPALEFDSGLPGVLEASVARSISTQAVLTMILLSPIGLALALEVLVARLAAERLRPSLALLAARGASRRQGLALVALPTLLVGLLAAAIGCAIGLALPGGFFGPAGVLAVLIVTVAPAVLLGVFAVPPAGAATGVPGRFVRVLRLVGELVLLLATVAALIAALQRGPSADAAGSIDFLSAAIPLLLSLLGCIVALRLYPVLVRRALSGAHRARGIGAFVGLARSIRGGTAGLVPLLAVILGVSVAVFSGVLSATLTAGLDTAARTSVGADIALEQVRLTQADLDDLSTIDGVDGLAGIAIDRAQRFAFAGHDGMSVSVGLIDAAQLAAVQDRVPGRVPQTDLLTGAAGTVVEALVSTDLSDALGGETTATLNGVPVTVVGDPLAGRPLTLKGNWVLIDRAHADTIDFISPRVSTRVLARVTEGADTAAVADALSAAVQTRVGDFAASASAPAAPEATAVIVTTPEDIRAELGTNPTVRDVHAAAVLAILGAVLITAVALMLTLLLEGPARRATVARLTALGLSRRQGAAMVRWEVAPLSIAGLLGGVLLGAALSLLVLVVVDLRPFTGGYDQPSVTVDPLITGGTVLLFAGVFAVTGAVAARRATSVSAQGSPAARTTHNAARAASRTDSRTDSRTEGRTP